MGGQASKCPICGKDESVLHLFWFCPLAKSAWVWVVSSDAPFLLCVVSPMHQFTDQMTQCVYYNCSPEIRAQAQNSDESLGGDVRSLGLCPVSSQVFPSMMQRLLDPDLAPDMGTKAIAEGAVPAGTFLTSPRSNMKVDYFFSAGL
eukprot:Gb_36022 [translate_table: standard]